jgi:Ser/Thr protein kinase RdoA (MazF antagonist)
MSDAASFSAILRDQYDVQHVQVAVFSGSSNEERAVFQVDHAHGERWIVRALRRDLPVVDWLGGCGTNDTLEWLQARAQTLIYLEQQGYRAPCVIRTRTGASVGEQHGWCTLATTFIAGQVAQPTLDQLRLLGAALGKLHQVPLPHNGSVGKSWWYPEHTIPNVLAQLASVEGQVPAAWAPLHAAMRTTLETAQHWSHLPRAVLHGDAWAGNGVQTSADQVVLIDWDPSGLGWAIADLGRLLLECHLDIDMPMEVLPTPDVQRINAVVDGYCAERVPTDAELDVLLEAMRFTVAVGGAWYLAQGPRLGWNDQLARRLARRQHRYDVSGEIAHIARRRFAQQLA